MLQRSVKKKWKDGKKTGTERKRSIKQKETSKGFTNNLDMKEKRLGSDVVKTNGEMNIVKYMLKDANKGLDQAIQEGNMTKKNSQEIIAVADKKYPLFRTIWKNRQRSGMKTFIENKQKTKNNYYGEIIITKTKKKLSAKFGSQS